MHIYVIKSQTIDTHSWFYHYSHWFSTNPCGQTWDRCEKYWAVSTRIECLLEFVSRDRLNIEDRDIFFCIDSIENSIRGDGSICSLLISRLSAQAYFLILIFFALSYFINFICEYKWRPTKFTLVLLHRGKKYKKYHFKQLPRTSKQCWQNCGQNGSDQISIVNCL